jgi:hypothetical protein
MLRIEGGWNRRMIGVRVIVAEHFLTVAPELGFHAPQVVGVYQIAVRVIGATVRQRHNPKHFLHLTDVAGQNAAALGWVCPLSLMPDLRHQLSSQTKGHTALQR